MAYNNTSIKDRVLQIIERIGLSLVMLMGWLWRDDEFDAAANGVLEDMLTKQKL